MPGRPRSIAAKDLSYKRAHDALMARAVQAYLAELDKPYRGRRGLRTICKEIGRAHV